MASIREGHAEFSHPRLAGKECRTWYRVVGDLTAGRRPLVLLHGGPGSGHQGLTKCFDAYPSLTGTPVVYYDQLGCGNSTRLPETRGDESLWTPALFVAELDNLLRRLGIREGFDLLGHSWGAKLAAKYAVSDVGEGSGLHRIVLSSGTANQKDLIRTVRDDVAAMDERTQDVIRRCIADGREDRHEYQLALWEFLKKRVSPAIAAPQEGENLMKRFVPDDVVYSTMLGVDPLHVEKGSLRTFDMTEECKLIKQPVLLLHGEHEEEYQVQPFFDGIPKVKWRVLSGSAHMAHAEQPENFRAIVSNFLNS